MKRPEGIAIQRMFFLLGPTKVGCQFPVKIYKPIKAMVGSCDPLGVQLIAEGVETADEYTALRECGVRFMQGYLLAKPEFEALPEVRFPDGEWSVTKRKPVQSVVEFPAPSQSSVADVADVASLPGFRPHGCWLVATG